MTKNRVIHMSMAPKYVKRRKVAVVVMAALLVGIGGFLVMWLDAAAEGACVTQLDAKSEWAVAYSKSLGEYPF